MRSRQGRAGCGVSVTVVVVVVVVVVDNDDDNDVLSPALGLSSSSSSLSFSSMLFALSKLFIGRSESKSGVSPSSVSVGDVVVMVGIAWYLV